MTEPPSQNYDPKMNSQMFLTSLTVSELSNTTSRRVADEPYIRVSSANLLEKLNSDNNATRSSPLDDKRSWLRSPNRRTRAVEDFNDSKISLKTGKNIVLRRKWGL